MVLVQKWSFFQLLFFRQYRSRKCPLRYSRTRKRFSIKKRSSKSRKIAIFPKELTHGFSPKLVIFPTSFFSAK